MREWSYATLQPREQSVADAFAEGAIWSPDYFKTWLKRTRQDVSADEHAAAGSDKSFESAYIRALLRGEVKRSPDQICCIDDSGAHFQGAHFAGDLDLKAIKFRKPLHFENCTFSGDIVLADARLGHVCFVNGRLSHLNANRLVANNEFRFEQMQCQSLHLHSARIAASVSLEGSTFRDVTVDKEKSALDLADAMIGGHLSLEGITSAGGVRLVGASIGTSLFLTGAQLSTPPGGRALHAGYTTVGNAVYMKAPFQATGPVVFRGAKIGAGVHCENAVVHGELNFAIAEIGGSLFLECAELTCVPADQDDTAVCRSPETGVEDGEVKCQPDLLPDAALNCWNAKIGANVFLTKVKAKGAVIFDMAEIGGSFRAVGGRFENPQRKSLNCASASIGVSVFLEDVTTLGQVDFIHTEVGGRFVCTGGSFDFGGWREGDKPRALNCDGIRVKGGVFLDGPVEEDERARCAPFEAHGAVYFHDAKIGGDLVCRGGRFINVLGASLVLSSAEISGSVHFSKGFLSIGEVYCRGATIGGNVHCQGGLFHDGLTDQATQHEVDTRDAVDLEGVSIGRCLFLTGIRRFRGRIDLQGASAQTFADDGSVWRSNWRPDKPSPDEDAEWVPADLSARFGIDEAALHGKRGLHGRRWSQLWGARVRRDFNCIQLDRFVFDAFADDDRLADDDGKPDIKVGVSTDMRWQARYALLQRQPKDWLGKDFRTQPFTQCARVLRQMGDRKSAQSILFQRERGRLCHREVWRIERWLRQFFFGWCAGYGYKAQRAFFLMVAIWIVGFCVYATAYIDGKMRVASENVVASEWYIVKKPKFPEPGSPPPDYEPFKPLVYSLDVMLPIIDLSQKHAWVPRDRGEGHGATHHLRDLREFRDVAKATDFVEPILERDFSWQPKFYYWFEIVMGWFLSTVMIAALTGLLGSPRED